MTNLENALYAHWISRLGLVKVKQLTDSSDPGLSLADRAKLVVQTSTEAALRRFVMDGFAGFFHQTVYMRTLANTIQCTDAIRKVPTQGSPVNDVVFQDVINESNTVRCLLFATKSLEFLQRGSGQTTTVDIPFPILITAADNVLTVRILTMQSTVETWGEIIGSEVRKLLNIVSSDSLHDQTIDALKQLKAETGDYADYSESARVLITRTDVNTYSGKLEVGTAGSSTHDTVRGKGKRSLRESMPEKFQELISARRIISAEVELGSDFAGLSSGTKMALYPTTGKLAFRSHFEGRDPDEFIKILSGS